MRGNSWVGWLGGVGVLMGSVFLVTFLNNWYTKPPKAPTNPEGPINTPLSSVADLTFYQSKYPVNPEIPAIVQEYKAPGYHDFWFTNETKETVFFGLDRKNCTCSSVEVFVVPDSWLKTPEALAIGSGKSPTAGQLSDAHEAKKPALLALESSIKPTALENQDRVSITVPSGSLGWVRLRYNNDKVGPINLFATLWYGKFDSGINSRLEIRNDVVPLMRADTNEIRLGLISPSRQVGSGEVIAYSSTREKIDVAFESRIKLDKGDILETKGPFLLNAQELGEFSKKIGGPVKSAYRFVVKGTLPKVGADQAQTEFGPFVRPFRLVCRDLDETDTFRNYSVNVGGAIDSEVRVLGASNEGFVEFRNFPINLGKKVRARLETSNTDIKLEVDTTRTSKFLKVVQVGEPEKLSRGIGYDFDIIIEPNKVNGAFPREDDPALRDSAFYIRTAGKTPKLIRVPVNGRGDG